MAHQEELRKFADQEQAARQEAMVTTEAQVRPTKEIVATIQLNRFRARACEAPSAGVGFVFERPNFERPGYERCQRLRGDPLSRPASPPVHGADTLSAGRLARVASRPPKRRQAASSASCRICSGR